MPAFYQDDDVPAMMRDFGVSVTFDAITLDKGALMDYVDNVTLKENGIAGVTNKAITCILQTSAFPSLAGSDAVGKSITVDGTAYVIRQRLQQSDGAITHLLCTS